MKFIYAMIIVVLGFAGTNAQSPSKVLRQAEKALGGTRALQSVRSVQKTGTVTRLSDGVSGRFVEQYARPNLYYMLMELGGFESETGFNGRSAWSRNSREGLQTLTGEATISLRSRASFVNNLWLNVKADKSKLVPGGRTMIDGKNVNLVTLTTNKNVSIKLYFDAASGMLVRDEMPGIDGPATTEYSDYRSVGGVMQPYAIRISSGNQKYDVKLEDVKINQPIVKTKFDFPDISGKALPDPITLMADLRANEDKVDEMLDTYAFTQKQTKREMGKDGVLRELSSETFQLSFYKGYRITRLIEKNGKPLGQSEQANADKDAGKRVAEIEKLLAKDGSRTGTSSSTGPPSRGSRISIAEVLRASKLLNPRRERFRGRDVIVFDFEPNPDFDYKNAKSMIKFFGKTAGVIWVDETDKQVARVEAVLFDNFNVGGGILAKLRKGASFTIEQQRVNDEIWLPSQADINLSVRVLLVKGIDVNTVIRSYDYRKFDTEVKDATVNEVKKP